MNKNQAIVVLSLIVIIAVAFMVTLYIYVQNSGHKKPIWSLPSGPVYVSGINISPSIYSPQNNIAVLNELASFNVTVFNYTNETLDVKVSVIGDDNLLYNESFNVSHQSVNTKIVYEKLSYTGLWLVTASSNNTRMGSTYSFQTLTNAEEANAQISALSNVTNQQNSTNWSNTLTLLAIVSNTIIGVAALTIAVYSLKKKKTESDG